eukprot:2872965-Amphidinium_carterae.1
MVLVHVTLAGKGEHPRHPRMCNKCPSCGAIWHPLMKDPSGPCFVALVSNCVGTFSAPSVMLWQLLSKSHADKLTNTQGMRYESCSCDNTCQTILCWCIVSSTRDQ